MACPVVRGLAAAVLIVSALVRNDSWALPATKVFELAAASSVLIFVDDRSGGRQVQGSGVVVAIEGIVATNCHLFAGRQGYTISILLSGQTHAATILESRPETDICILKVPTIRAPAAKIVPMASLKVGQRVYAVGAPMGLELTLTEGLISGIRRTNDQRLLQTSAPISPGSSGGGLFDEDGRLIGITSFALRGGNQLNFAVPADSISPLLALQWPRSGDYPTPHLVFPTEAEGWSWLADMSSRLASRVPDSQLRRDFLVTVQFEAVRAGLEPALILALIEVASDFRKYAVSSTQSRGYMQVAPVWLKQIGLPSHDLFNLRTNVRYGCTLMGYFVEQANGDVGSAVERYARENDLHPAAHPALRPRDFKEEVARAQRRWTISAPRK